MGEEFANIRHRPSNLDINQIRIEPAQDKSKWIYIRKEIGSFVYRQPPGRNFKFFVWLGETLIGILELSSPVINLGARDKYLGLIKCKNKGQKLRHIMDMTTCMPLQPFGYEWNGGKLIALLGTTLKDEVFEKYGDELKNVTTMARNSRPTMYDRVLKFLGYTQGKTFSHISDKRYEEMLNWMRENNISIPSAKFGAGANARQRKILSYKKHSGDTSVKYEMVRRPIYIDKGLYSSNERNQIVEFWYSRWGFPRYEKKGKKNESQN